MLEQQDEQLSQAFMMLLLADWRHTPSGQTVA